MKYFVAIVLLLATFNAAASFPSDAALSLLKQGSNSVAGSPLCLSIDNKAASKTLVTMATAENIRISPIMDCEYNKENQTVVHQQSGQRACFMSISDFKKSSSTLATAKYSINCGFMATSNGTVIFTHLSNQWSIKAVKVVLLE